MTHAHNFLDLTNEVFGNVRVIEWVGRRRGHAVWACRCLVYGREFEETGCNLRAGKVHRCNACRIRLFPLRSKLAWSERRMNARKRAK